MVVPIGVILPWKVKFNCHVKRYITSLSFSHLENGNRYHCFQYKLNEMIQVRHPYAKYLGHSKYLVNGSEKQMKWNLCAQHF